MATFLVRGGNSLYGSVRLGGAKNVSYKLMITALLGSSESRILNFSHISDVQLVKDLINHLGARAYHAGERTMFIDPEGLDSYEVPAHFGEGSRASSMFLPVLLKRFGKARVPAPGGDKLGKRRPLDRHFMALQALGADIRQTNDGWIEAEAKELRGTTVRFEKSTHTGTETAIMGAVCARGTTILENAAEEPEVDDLIHFLNSMGARIRRRAHRVIEIEGVAELHGAIHSIMPDQNEAVSYAVAAVATKGDIIVENARADHMTAFLKKLEEMGGGFEVGSYGIRFFWKGDLRATDIVTDVYPGFKTDWQPVWSVLLTQAQGTSEIHEAVWVYRFQYAKALQEMGAHIELYNPEVREPAAFYHFNLDEDSPDYAHAIRITGPTALRPVHYTVPDLRAGATILLASLLAEGQSTIVDQGGHVERGYEAIVDRLTSMGADITVK